MFAFVKSHLFVRIIKFQSINFELNVKSPTIYLLKWQLSKGLEFIGVGIILRISMHNHAKELNKYFTSFSLCENWSGHSDYYFLISQHCQRQGTQRAASQKKVFPHRFKTTCDKKYSSATSNVSERSHK